MPEVTYKPEVFSVRNVQQAKEIILTNDSSGTTDERWEHETPIVADLLTRGLSIQPDHLVLDYGCGIGRVAKALIDRHHCSIIGVDISTSMMQLAMGYVGAGKFSTMPAPMLDAMIARGMRFDSAYSVWVIQHCYKPDEDLKRIAAALKPGGIFQILNFELRLVPVVDENGKNAWYDDGIDVLAMLRSIFSEVTVSDLPPEILPAHQVEMFYQAICRK